jgi:LPS export ABC transporter protein LptC
MNSLKSILSPIILSALLALTGCAKKKESLPVTTDNELLTNYQELGKTTLFSYEGKFKRWRLDADYMRRPLTDTGSTLVTPVRMIFYDTLGHFRTRVIADSGTIAASLESFTVWGHVFIRNQDSLTVRTHKLWWIKSKRKVLSDVLVTIQTAKGDVLEGIGLDAVEDFSHFTLKSNVKAKILDFKDRVDKNNDKVF